MIITNNFFSRDENGVETVTLPVCSNCEGCRGYDCLDNNDVSLAIAYVPMQKFEDLYTPAEAYSVGTLFRKLNKPFLGRNVLKEGTR